MPATKKNTQQKPHLISYKRNEPMVGDLVFIVCKPKISYERSYDVGTGDTGLYNEGYVSISKMNYPYHPYGNGTVATSTAPYLCPYTYTTTTLKNLNINSKITSNNLNFDDNFLTVYGYKTIKDYVSGNSTCVVQTEPLTKQDIYKNKFLKKFGCKPILGIVLTKKNMMVTGGPDFNVNLFQILFDEKNILWFAEDDIRKHDDNI